MNKGLRRLRTEEFPNLANFIEPIESFATGLANVNGHGHIRVEPATQVTNTVERLNGRITNGNRVN